MPDGSPYDTAVIVDILVTWIGGVSLGLYAMALGTLGGRSLLERRARFLFGVLALVLFVRGFAWLAPDHTGLDFLVFGPLSLLPIAMTLFAEALLRRHAPMWIKVLATVATSLALLGNTARGFVAGTPVVPVIDAVDLIGLVATMFALAWLLARRDRSTLSAAENSLVRICALLAIVGVPLAVTDYRTAIGAPPVRLGTIGALVFCYSLLRRPEENTHLGDWLRDLRRILVKAAIACALLAVALGATNARFIVPLSVLAIAVILAFAIFDDVRDATAATSHHDLLRWLGRPTPGDADEFAGELSRLPLTGDATIVQGDELDAYDRDALVGTFVRGRTVFALAELRRVREKVWDRARGADQLTDLLERRGATHVALLSTSPLRLLVVAVPELGHATDVELALAAVARRGDRIAS